MKIKDIFPRRKLHTVSICAGRMTLISKQINKIMRAITLPGIGKGKNKEITSPAQHTKKSKKTCLKNAKDIPSLKVDMKIY